MLLTDLEIEYANAVRTAKADHDWYRKHRWGYIAFSWLVRGAAVVGITAGILLPLLHPTGTVMLLGIGFTSGAQAAIASLLVAGLLLGLNQVFLITSTWSRYAGAMLRIGSLLRLIEWDWKILKAGWAAEVDADGVRKARELFRNLVAESSKIVETETATWSSELAKAVESLAALIKDQRGAVETQLKELQKAQDEAKKEAAQARTEQERASETARKANAPGAVRLKFEGAVSRLQGQVKVTLAGAEQVSDAKTLSFVFNGVEPGLKELVVVFQDSNANAVTLRSVVEVASGKVAEASIAVPGA